MAPACAKHLAALLTGATFHIADLRQNGINAVFRTLKSAGGTVLAFVPSVLRSFTARPDAAEALASLRIVDLFGELVTADAVAALRSVLSPSCHIRVSLGSTETMVLFHWFVPRDFAAGDAGLPCGYLANNASISVLDEAGASVAPGDVGELVVRGRYIASGMWRDGNVLAGPFRQDPDDPASRVFHTGDLIRLREDGLAEFVGRRDRRVKIRGLRADPGDVEVALHRIPGIADCAVVTRSSGDDTVFLAYVVAGAPRPRFIRTNSRRTARRTSTAYDAGRNPPAGQHPAAAQLQAGPGRAGAPRRRRHRERPVSDSRERIHHQPSSPGLRTGAHAPADDPRRRPRSEPLVCGCARQSRAARQGDGNPVPRSIDRGVPRRRWRAGRDREPLRPSPGEAVARGGQGLQPGLRVSRLGLRRIRTTCLGCT